MRACPPACARSHARRFPPPYSQPARHGGRGCGQRPLVHHPPRLQQRSRRLHSARRQPLRARASPAPPQSCPQQQQSWRGLPLNGPTDKGAVLHPSLRTAQITFTLPAVNLNSTANGTRSGGRDGSGGGSGGPYVDTSKQAVCTFYDEVAEAYSQDGCVAIPNPLPAGLTASWVAGFTANRTLDLAKSWALSDNGTAAGLLANCDMAFIDCSDPAQANVTIYPNKRLPLKYPAISCGGVTSARIIRVFNGSQCRLIDTDNQEGCYWNATSQVSEASALRRAATCLLISPLLCETKELCLAYGVDSLSITLRRSLARAASPATSRAAHAST